VKSGTIRVEASVVSQKLSWVGLRVGDYVIEELLGEGSYSWVFKAVHVDQKWNAKAIKVAKPPEAVDEGGPTSCIPTDAYWPSGGTVITVKPETEQLLCLQAKQLQAISDPGLVMIEEVSVSPGSCYYRMPIIRGNNLRRFMTAGPVHTDILLDIARCLKRLSETEIFYCHGDLKPENIMVTAAGMVLIDPGYYGTIEAYKGATKQPLSNCAVTSTLYYPYLHPDDLLALGLLTWEIACREHPLAKKTTSKDFDRKTIGAELWTAIQEEEKEGKFFLSPLLGLKRPSVLRPGIPSDLERFLLRCLKVKFETDGKLNADIGFQDFGEYTAALTRLAEKGIRYL